MAYHDDLLAQAATLLHQNLTNPKQSDLRRAASSAYYALFHMLIAEMTSNYGHVTLRPLLGKAFDHQPMKETSKKFSNGGYPSYRGKPQAVVADLCLIARTFVQLQQQRHFADYNLTKDLLLTDATAQVVSAQTALTKWQAIRTEDVAQEYLVSLAVRHWQ
jgi:hypothetical protein